MTWWLGIFERFFQQVPWDIDQLAAPWGNSESIYSTIKKHQAGGSFGGNCPLPDDHPQSPDSLTWIAGGLDGSMGHNGVYGEDAIAARKIIKHITRLFRKPTDQRFAELYNMLSEQSALSYVDPLLEFLIDDPQFHTEKLHELAMRLAVGSPHREVVKVAVAILGLFTKEEDAPIFMILGRHEEFTLYAAVAISNALKDADEALWELAKEVHGWGRIHLVERMGGTDNVRIRQWMLREGYNNKILVEYLAYTCATTGDLLTDLRRPEVDPELLVGAGELLQALINGRGGPSFGILDYDDGPECVENYLRHLEGSSKQLREFLIVQTIVDFLKCPNIDWENRREQGWTSYRHFHLIKSCEAFIENSQWLTLVKAGLKSHESVPFLIAAQAASYLEVDTWPEFFRRLEKGEEYWPQVLQTEDCERVSRVLALARSLLSLDELSSGPGMESGVGPMDQEHRCLDTIVQELSRFSGMGVVLVLACLKSPVIRNRLSALKTLAYWGPGVWTEEILEALATATEIEPEEALKKDMKQVLSGKGIGEKE